MANPDSPWPLVLYGPAGVGKSALAETLACRLNKTCQWITADEIRRQFHAAVATKSVSAFQDKMRNSEMLLLDNLVVPGDEPSLCREIVQIIEHYTLNRRPVVVTMPTPPWMIDRSANQLRSRLSEGLVLEIRRPGKPARRNIVSGILQKLNLKIENNDLDWLVNALPETVPLIKNRLSRFALMSSQPHLSRMDLKTGLPTGQKTCLDPQLMHQLTKLVARQFGQRISEITGKSRRQEVVRARSVTMYLARDLLSATFREIGEMTGRRDASTVRHACRQIAANIAHEPVLADAVQHITNQFSNIQQHYNKAGDNLSAC